MEYHWIPPKKPVDAKKQVHQKNGGPGWGFTFDPWPQQGLTWLLWTYHMATANRARVGCFEGSISGFANFCSGDLFWF